MKIGVGITTTNPEKYMQHFPKWDGIILFNTDQISIARDKNKLIKQLFNLGCTDIFLFDDDCFPIKEGWDTWITDVDHAVLGEQIPGCMLYLNRKTVETAGYMNTTYGKYGWEHLGYYNRIVKSGLAVKKLEGWEEYFYSYDLQGNAHNFIKEEWQTLLQKEERSLQNQPIFEAECASSQIYYPYEQVAPKQEHTGKLQVLYMYQYDFDPTFYYRLAVLKYINSPDIEFTRKPYGGEITWSTLQQYDVLILERPSGEHDLNLIKLAKQVKCKIVTDWDDDCLSVDMYNPMYAQYQASRNNVMEALCLSDEVWVTTEGLKKAFSLFNNNITVVPNAHNDYLQPISQKKAFNPAGKVALWRGGQSHEADVYSYQKELVSLIKKNKKWAFVFFGDRFMGIQMQCEGVGNYIPVSPKPLMEYFDKIHKLNPQIVFHPLRDTAFNRSKSPIAWLEASYAGAAFFGNRQLEEFNKTCIFNFNENMIKFHADDLRIANKHSWECICENYLLSKVNELRKERLLSL
jgi:hypothetical protein